MRDLVQTEILAQLAEVDQELHQAAIIGLEERLEDGQSKQLVLREVLSGKLRRIGGQGVASKVQSLSRHRPRRFGHGACCSSHGT